MYVESDSYHWKTHYYCSFLSVRNLSEVPKFASVHIHVYIYIYLYLYMWHPEFCTDWAALYCEDSQTVFLVFGFWLKFQNWLICFPAYLSSCVSEKITQKNKPTNEQTNQPTNQPINQKTILVNCAKPAS